MNISSKALRSLYLFMFCLGGIFSVIFLVSKIYFHGIIPNEVGTFGFLGSMGLATLCAIAARRKSEGEGDQRS